MSKNLHVKYSLVLGFLALFNLNASEENKITIDNRISIIEGLSQSRITCIIEDQRGFMWFGTDDGLNRYNGYEFKIFKNDKDNPHSIPGNEITCITEDKDGYLWIGTNNGLASFNIFCETFTSYTEKDSILVKKGANQIKSCSVDNNNNIWCSTNGAGIFKINNGLMEREYPEMLSSYKTTSTIFIDKDNNLWIGDVSDNIVESINLTNYSINSYPIKSKFDKTYQSAFGLSLCQASNGKIWINVSNIFLNTGGLYYLDTLTSEFVDVCHHFSNEFTSKFRPYLRVLPSLTKDNNGNIYAASATGLYFKIKNNFEPEVFFEEKLSEGVPKLSIYKSRNNLIWLGLNGKGIQVSKSESNSFNLISSEINPDFTVQSIRTITEDKEYYWVSGYSSLVKINKTNKKVFTIPLDLPIIYTLANVPNNSNLLWIGTEGNGLKLLDKSKNRIIKKIEFTQQGVENDFFNFIYHIHIVSDSLLLLGTAGGVVGYNPITDNYQFYTKTNNQEINRITNVSTIMKNNAGDIIIGYSHGEVAKFDLQKKRIVDFELLGNGPLKNNSLAIKCIYNDFYNNYWIATTNGLIYYNPENDSTRIFSDTDGLPNNYIYSILPDNKNNLWLSTNKGICCYNPDSDNFQNFDVNDGLQSNEFNTGAYYKANDGTLFFGGIAGLNYFNPDKIKSNTILPTVEINSIRIGNRNIGLNNEITEKNTLVIEPEQNVFTIDFVGLSYLNSDKNRYKYRIKQIDNNWIDIGKRHYISFNNMKHGYYELEILASNNHGVWIKEPFKLNIEIKPRFYETTWFKILLILIVIASTIAFIRLRIVRLEQQKIKLQKLVDAQTIDLKTEIEEHKKTAEELIASNNTKDMFLSVIAHDILNPLAAIISFSDLLCAEHHTSEDKKLNWSRMINTSANNLKNLLHNLIQWSKLEREKMVPEPQILNLKYEIDSSLQLVRATINQKNIALSVDMDDSLILYTDINMFSTIIRNILSNAVKFTPKNGNISISGSAENGFTNITIKDTGVGIEKEKLKNILDTKKTLSSRGTGNEAGTGIGLNLVIGFIKLCRGKINVESEPGQGTKFSILLPGNKETFEEMG